MEYKASESPSSSMDSCSSQPPAAAELSTASSGYRPAISKDLHLGLSLPSCSSSVQTDNSHPSTPRSALTTSTTAVAAAYERGCGGGCGGSNGQRSLFVKVYMEGVPVGRKLDLLLVDGYDGLVGQLRLMFKACITYPDVMGGHQVVLAEKKQDRHVLTYEDQERDWMMVGDVPWEYVWLHSRHLTCYYFYGFARVVWNYRPIALGFARVFSTFSSARTRPSV